MKNPDDDNITIEETQSWEIMVPCQYNDGGPVRTRHHKNWDEKVRRITGGLTVLKPAKGQWVHEEKLYEERMIPVRIACSEAQIRQIMKITARHYHQIAVLASLISEKTLVATYK